MEESLFEIVYCPFPDSDVTTEMRIYSTSTEKALDWFQRFYPAATVKSVKELA
jgi:hypothetical protein